jgi:hypothetical protein
MQTNAYAWCPIAHYIIAKFVRYEKGISYPAGYKFRLEHYSNLPDYIDSQKFGMGDGASAGKVLTMAFCWSHGAQDTGNSIVGLFTKADGYLSYNLIAPDCPIYPDDGRYPGFVMKELITKKLNLPTITPNSPLHMKLIDTTNGFRVHNASDRQVHFGYFLAAQDSLTFDQNAEIWVVHHGLKEVWADYVLLHFYGFTDHMPDYSSSPNININCDKFVLFNDGIEDRNNAFPDSAPVLKGHRFAFADPCLGFQGSAPLMHFAQCVYRKNRRSMKADKECDSYEVESVESIKAQIENSDESNHVTQLFTKAPWATWEYSENEHLVRLLKGIAERELIDIEYSYLDPTTGALEKEGYNVPVVPTTHSAEWNELLRLKDFLQRRYASAGASMNTVWSNSSVRSKSNASIDTSKEWVYSTSQLKLRHHK